MLLLFYAQFDWIDFLDAVYPGKKWDPQFEVVVYCSEFLEDLNRLLAGHNQTYAAINYNIFTARFLLTCSHCLLLD